MVRHTYVHEMRSALTYPLAAALAEGGFTSVVAAKYFHADTMLLAVITAAPMFGNIFAMIWAQMAEGRRKVPFVNWLQAGVVGSIATVALTYWMPVHIGAWVFAGLIILARILASGIVTVRSTIWRLNYPRQNRAQIVGRITVVAMCVLFTATLGGAAWLDREPHAFVYLYPLAGVLGLLGIWQFSRIRVRREGQTLRKRLLQPMYTPRPESMSSTDETNVMNYQPTERRGLLDILREARGILRNDKLYRQYQWLQFFQGAAFMSMTPPLMKMVSHDMTDRTSQYLLATVVLQLIPQFFTMLFTQVWAPLFDRVHILRFRVYQGYVSAAALTLLWVAAEMDSLWLVAAAQVLIGVSMGGGNLAWNLGHNDFSTPEKSSAYMGVHVMLTGVRGCVAPFAGVLLYSLIDRHVFGVSALLTLVALVGFAVLSRKAPAKVPLARAHQKAVATGR